MFQNYLRFILSTLGLVLLISCGRGVVAPVEELQVFKPKKYNFYYVASGDTLYSIAFLEGVDYRNLAKWNYLESPYILNRGQKIFLTKPENYYQAATRLDSNVEASLEPIQANPSVNQNSAQPASNNENVNFDSSNIQGAVINNAPNVFTKNVFDNTWIWPVNVVPNSYKDASQNMGLDILAAEGSPVLASAAGEVVYASSGLKGYGNLVIIKHDAIYLSAYAHNRKILINEGERVSQGQAIAELGSTDTNIAKLHFEIRKEGEPVYPLNLLPK